MQFNKSKESYYLASTTAAPGAIRSVTVKLNSGSERPWKLLTSDTAYGEVAGKPTDGTDRGTKTVTADGVTWTLDGDDKIEIVEKEEYYPPDERAARLWLNADERRRLRDDKDDAPDGGEQVQVVVDL